MPIQHFIESIARQCFGGVIQKLSANKQSNEMKPQIWLLMQLYLQWSLGLYSSWSPIQDGDILQDSIKAVSPLGRCLLLQMRNQDLSVMTFSNCSDFFHYLFLLVWILREKPDQCTMLRASKSLAYSTWCSSVSAMCPQWFRWSPWYLSPVLRSSVHPPVEKKRSHLEHHWFCPWIPGHCAE